MCRNMFKVPLVGGGATSVAVDVDADVTVAAGACKAVCMRTLTKSMGWPTMTLQVPVQTKRDASVSD